jgi:ribosomal protein S18 acetylase RimI-like enzyme
MDGPQVFDPVKAKVTIDVTIRPCVEADLPALEWMGLYAGHRDIIRQAFEAQQHGDALLLLSVSGHFPVGQVWIDFARKRADGIAVMWAVRTFYPLQGAGIGSRMMKAAESVLRERGICQTELAVEKLNAGALRFYERLGWRIVGPWHENLGHQGQDLSPVSERLGHWLLTKNVYGN